MVVKGGVWTVVVEDGIWVAAVEDGVWTAAVEDKDQETVVYAVFSVEQSKMRFRNYLLSLSFFYCCCFLI